MRYPDFSSAIGILKDRMRTAPVVHTERWQGLDISKKPEAATHELMNIFFTVAVPAGGIDQLIKEVQPNLPWADDHFAERVSGMPLNPPPSWKTWPWGHSAGNFLDQRGQFSHTYPERFWPKYAGLTRGGVLPPHGEVEGNTQLTGIRYRYGDLGDVVNLLEREPLTRQAFLPVWYPEDTGATHGERTPCTIGYHFMIRRGALHLFYYIRSCEIVRHFRDDVYLAVRLQLWVIDKLRERDPIKFKDLVAGDFTMHICSFHMFVNDHIAEFGR